MLMKIGASVTDISQMVLFHFEFLSMSNLSVSGEVFWMLILYLSVKLFKSWVS
jgi:hypothetical protein